MLTLLGRGWGLSLNTFYSNSSISSAWNGTCKAQSSKSITPKAQISVLLEQGLFSQISGAK